MNKSAYVSVRVRPDLKNDAEKILKSLGVTPTDAITIFYTQIKMHHGFPFPVEIPNAVTRQAIQEAANDVDMQVSHSMAEFMKAMEE